MYRIMFVCFSFHIVSPSDDSVKAIYTKDTTTINMTSSNLYDYNVKLVGLLPLGFDWSKDENYGVRFQTNNLKEIKKPSEDRHEGPVIISDENLLCSTAVAETKIIQRNIEVTNSNMKKVCDEVTTLANEVNQIKLTFEDGVERGIEDRDCEKVNQQEPVMGEAHDENMNQEPREENDNVGNDHTEMESDEDEPVDKIMQEEHSARFLYKSFYSMTDKKPDFLSYRLPLMNLAIKSDPYFFKVNKIRFKPYGCEEEMEFIQIHWPIILDDLYESHDSSDGAKETGWSGPQFNKWATTEFTREKSSTHEQTASPVVCEKATTSHGDNARSEREDPDVDEKSSSSYHRAYLLAEIKPNSVGQSRDVAGYSNATRGFNIFIAALIGGVWKFEEDPDHYTCQHLAEMRTVKEETLRNTRYNNPSIFYKRVRMLSNYWQCYLAGEQYYLVGVNGLMKQSPEETKMKRDIKELRLYEVSKVPGFIKKSGAEQGFRPWSKEILENRLYKSLSVIYEKVIHAPVGTEFMFVKYNEFDPPVHDVDGSITRPYLIAFRQLVIEGLPSPSPPELVKRLMFAVDYKGLVQLFEERKFTSEDIPKTEEKENRLILTFKDKSLANLFLMVVQGLLSYLRENDKFPIGCGMENLKIMEVTMKKPVASGNNTQSWRNSNQRQQQSNTWNNDNGRKQNYSRQFYAPSKGSGSEMNWRKN